MTDDDLGSFFSEINEIEQKIEGGEVPANDVDSEHIAKKVAVEKEVAVAAPVVQVVAKPQVITRAPERIEVPVPQADYSSTTAVLMMILCI